MASPFHGLLAPFGAECQKSFTAVIAAIQQRSADPSTDSFLDLLDWYKLVLYRRLQSHFRDPTTAMAVTSKILNLCLARHHLLQRSVAVLSQPYGLIADPSNGCGLACPGCVHSSNARRLRLFDWDHQRMPASLMEAFLHRYGPSALQVHFFNYGEPLLHPSTPAFIRHAKMLLLRTMVSTSLSVPHFDADALVASGLDFLLVSIDGATGSTYRRFRRNGNWDCVMENLRRLVDAKRRLRLRTPVLRWQFLAFEHNAHEIPLARQMAEDAGVDEFAVATPFDVSWDDQEIRPARLAPSIVPLHHETERYMARNWNPFPRALAETAITEAFATRYCDLAQTDTTANARAPHTCAWLYKNIVMDAGGRILPCCGAPRPDVELVYARFDAGSRPESNYNSVRYRQARNYFASGSASDAPSAPHCVRCDWDQEHVNIDREHIRQYFRAAGNGHFDEAATAMLADW